MQWSPQQDKALKQIDAWLSTPNGPKVHTLFGYAGTGKTTLAKTIAETVSGPVQFAAYTGKAASVMRAKGCYSAQTLHSLVYMVDGFVNEEEKELRAKIKEEADPAERSRLIYALRKLVDKVNATRWIINSHGPLADAALLILDECSMVDERLGKDILSFGKPVLVLGDPGQLPPPTGTGFFTNRKPDSLLTEVHRQAEGNPIIRLATMAREGRAIKNGVYGDGDTAAVVTVHREHFYDFEGQLLTGTNANRRRLNWDERCSFLESDDPPLQPQDGEPMIVLRNDREKGVFNGVLGTMAGSASWLSEGPDSDLRGDLLYEGRLMQDLLIDGSVFKQYEDIRAPQPPLAYNRDKLPLDFGYALTVHKAQGSEWPSVCLVDDGFGRRDPDTRAQWLYTAITRASERLMIYKGAL